MGKNITLRLDEGIIDRIRHIAVDRHTSVSAWVADLVMQTVTELDGFEQARKQALRAMASPVPVDHATPITRDEAHER
jgi:hypothetical protein